MNSASPSRKNAIDLLYRADAFLQAHRNHEAIGLYQAALSIDSSFREAYYRMALAFSRIGQHQAALDILAMNVKQYKTAASFNLMGRCLLLVGRLDEADKAYRRSLKIDKGNAEATAGLADILIQKEKVAEGFELLRPYIRRRIASVDVANVLTKICRKSGTCDEVLDYLLWIDGSADIDVTTRYQVKYMIGEIYDRKKSYADAIDAFIKANGLKPDNYDRSAHDRVRETMKRIYNVNGMAGQERSDCESDKPIFVVGMPRSGTTLVEQILSSHSRVHGAGELNQISNYVQQLSQASSRRYPECLDGLGKMQLNGLAGDYLQYIERLSGGAHHVTDKMPHNFVNLGLISQMFPKARIIHCRRNPIDTCLSIFCNRFDDAHPYATSFSSLAHHYRFYTDLMAHWEQCGFKMLDVNYEDLVQDINSGVERLLSFLGLPMEPACLEFHSNKRFVNTASKEQVVKPVYQSSIERWKNYMPAIQPLVDSLKSFGIHLGSC